MKYNPLQEFDIKDPNARRYLSAISNALVLDEGEKNKVWVSSGRSILEAIIAHVMSTYPENERTFPMIYDLLQGKKKNG